MWWLPLLLLVALLMMTTAEKFTEPQGTAARTIGQAQAPMTGPGTFATVTRPDRSSLWTSKIAANTPFGTEPTPYITALAAFYDRVYTPATARPKESDVDTFVKTPYPGTDPAALKTIIMEAFHIDSATSKNESKQTVFEPSAKLLAPKDGVDEVRIRTEDAYKPADMKGPFNDSALGKMAPTPQTIPSRGERRKRELTPIENI
jgi:hypothetical protein